MRSAKVLFFIMMIAISSNTFAIVSMQSLHLDAPKPGWKAGIDLNVSGARGNTKQVRVNTGANILHYQNDVTHFASFKFTYGESFGVEDQNKAYAHVRRIQKITNRTAWEVFTQLESNQFARLNLRALVGTGGRYKLFNTSTTVFYSGFGAFYSVEDIKKLDSDNEGGENREVKANIYGVYKYDISKSAVFVSTTYFQPILNKLSDFRILQNSSLRLKLTKKINLKLTLAIAHDNEPPKTIDKTDVSYLTGIELNF